AQRVGGLTAASRSGDRGRDRIPAADAETVGIDAGRPARDDCQSSVGAGDVDTANVQGEAAIRFSSHGGRTGLPGASNEACGATDAFARRQWLAPDRVSKRCIQTGGEAD